VRYTKENRAAALAYARAGIPVFPAVIYKAGNEWVKKPLLADWQRHATTDETVIDSWFKQRPDMIAGVVQDQTVTLDADRHDPEIDGVENFAQLCCDIGAPPRHPTISTPGGGQHHIFRQPVDEPLGNSTGRMGARNRVQTQ